MTPEFEIDHFFICVETGGPERQQLADIGLHVIGETRHSGQGTASVSFGFNDIYLELIWQTNESEITSDPVCATRLHERCAWKTTGASRFGIALRAATGSLETHAPFESWPYTPAYLPHGLDIPVSSESKRHTTPLVFFIPGPSKSDRSVVKRQIRATLLLPISPTAADLAFLQAQELLNIELGETEKLILECAEEDALGVDLAPNLPLEFRPVR